MRMIRVHTCLPRHISRVFWLLLHLCRVLFLASGGRDRSRSRDRGRGGRSRSRGRGRRSGSRSRSPPRRKDASRSPPRRDSRSPPRKASRSPPPRRDSRSPLGRASRERSRSLGAAAGAAARSRSRGRDASRSASPPRRCDLPELCPHSVMLSPHCRPVHSNPACQSVSIGLGSERVFVLCACVAELTM